MAEGTATGPSLKSNEKIINELISGGKSFLSNNIAVSEAATKLALSYGMSADALDRMARSMLTVSDTNKLAQHYGATAVELLNTQVNLSEKLQRNYKLNAKSAEDIAASISLIGAEKTTEMVSVFDQFGLGAEDGIKYVDSMYKTASKAGINLSSYSKNFVDNLKLAQTYTFKDGLSSLKEMAKQATELKFNMKDSVSFANKLWEGGVEGAVEAASKLQVLGGQFAALGDPLAMLNEGLNDMSSLQDRVTNMFGNMATFNKKTGEVEVSTFDRMRIRQAAQAMGMDYSSVMESIFAQGRRNEVAKQLSGYGGINENIKEKIINQATFQNGVAGVTINGEFRGLQEIAQSASLQEELLNETVSQEEDIHQIAQNVVSIEGQMSKLLATWGQKEAQMNYDTGEKVKATAYEITENETTNEIGGAAGVVGSAYNTVSGWINKTISNIGNALTFWKKENGGVISKFADGGVANGPSHAEGGIMATINKKPVAEIEGGEFVVNKKATEDPVNRIILEAINNSTLSGISKPSYKYDEGGILPGLTDAFAGLYTTVLKSMDLSSLSASTKAWTYDRVSANSAQNEVASSGGGSQAGSQSGNVSVNINGSIQLLGKDGQKFDINTLSTQELRDLYQNIIKAADAQIKIND